MTPQQARSGYHKDFEPNKDWRKHTCICKWEHCIELMPLHEVKKFPGDCPIFGHICPDGIYGVEHCKNNIDILPQTIIKNEKV